MASIDETLHALPAAGGAGGGWRRARSLALRLSLRLSLPLALPGFVVLGLAVGTLINLGLTESMGSRGGGLLVAGSAAAAEQGALVPPGVPPGICQRMHRIVETACSLGQRDHFASEIRRCVAQELRYTMWAPYGCR